MLAQYNNSKLETVLYTYTQQRKKWRIRIRNLIAGIIQSLNNRNGKLQEINFTLTFCLTFLENRSSRPERFYKIGVLKNFAKFTGKNLCQSCVFNKVVGLVCNFINKETLTQVFSCEFCEIFKNTFFYRTLSVAASVENQLFTKKRNRRFRRLPRNNMFWWESV